MITSYLGELTSDLFIFYMRKLKRENASHSLEYTKRHYANKCKQMTCDSSPGGLWKWTEGVVRVGVCPQTSLWDWYDLTTLPWQQERRALLLFQAAWGDVCVHVTQVSLQLTVTWRASIAMLRSWDPPWKHIDLPKVALCILLDVGSPEAAWKG